MKIIGVWPTHYFVPRPPWEEQKIFQKEQPVMVKNQSLSIHNELLILRAPRDIDIIITLSKQGYVNIVAITGS